MAVDSISTVSANGVIADVSLAGAKLITPITFRPGHVVRVEVEMIGGPFSAEATVVGAKEDTTAKQRFDETFVINVQFTKSLHENDFKNLLALSG